MDINNNKKLSQVRSNKGLHLTGKCSSPGIHCPMHTSLATLHLIKGVSTLVVGMPECCYYSNYITGRNKEKVSDNHYKYYLDSKEVVMGCKKGLSEAIIEMDNGESDVIAVIFTCIPSIIGEDKNAYLFELKDKLKAHLIIIDIPHFKTVSYNMGYSKTLESLATLYPKNEVFKCVNILGSHRSYDLNQVIDNLKLQNIVVNELSPNLSLNQIENSVKSSLNLVVDIRFQEFAIAQEKAYGIPFISLWDRYNPDEILETYRQISLLTGTESSVKPVEYKPINLELKNRTFSILSGEVESLSLAKYLIENSLDPIFIHIEEFYPFLKGIRNSIIKSNKDPFVGYANQVDSGLVESDLNLDSNNLLKISNLIGIERTQMINNLVNSIESREESNGTC